MGDVVDPTLFQGFAPSLSPGQAGTGGFVAPLVDDPNTAANQQGSGGIDAATLAKALGEIKGDVAGAQQPAVSNLPPGSNAASGGASSGAYSGNPGSMNAFVQMLMQRVQALRAASNPATARPVNMQGVSRPSGLLGL